jgi:hypothetical protein
MMETVMRRKPILCVDFDGVIHSYQTPWQNEFTIPDPPVPGALQWLWKATEWFSVIVYSSRSKTEAGRDAMQAWMRRWSEKEFSSGHPMTWEAGPVYPIGFAHEKPAAFLTIDDRAVEFDGDWNSLDPAAMLDFKPWYQRLNPRNRAER